MNTLVERLAEHDIRLRRYTPGPDQRLNCPKCFDGKRDNADSLNVTIDADGDGAVWECKRGTCGWKDGVRVHLNLFASPKPKPQRPSRPPPEPQPEQPDWFWRFWDARNIGNATVKALGVYAGTRYFQALGGEKPCIVFPYVHKGQRVGSKYRAHPEKQHSQDAPNPPTLFNADSIKPGCILVWNEGEPDVLASHEVGFTNVVSFKDGAPAKASPNDKRLVALETHAAVLAKVKRHIIATDTDGPGEALAEELSRRLGRHKCSRWTLPPDCKDACDVLVKHGTDALIAALRQAQPYPIEGIRRIPLDYSETLLSRPEPQVMRIGPPALDAILGLPKEGRLVVVTGLTNHGKSTFLRHCVVKSGQRYGRKWLAFVAEDDFDDCFVECMQMLLEHPLRGEYAASKEARIEANAMLAEIVTFVEYDSESAPPTIDSILQRAEAMTLSGLTDLALDPWNELEHQRPRDVTETDYVARVIQRLKAFAKRHGVNVWIVAHASKQGVYEAAKDRRPPNGVELAGSAHFGNKADLGLGIWRGPRDGDAELHIWKSRQRRMGLKDTKAKLHFYAASTCYCDPVEPLGNVADFNRRQRANQPPGDN